MVMKRGDKLQIGNTVLELVVTGAPFARPPLGRRHDVGRVRRTTRTASSPAPTRPVGRRRRHGRHQGGEVACEMAIDTFGERFVERSIDGLVDAVRRPTPRSTSAGRRPRAARAWAPPWWRSRSSTTRRRRGAGHRQRRRLPLPTASPTASSTSSPRTTAWWPSWCARASLSPEEAAVHPQRNIVTRVLGVYDEVPVDVFAGRPRPGRPLPAVLRRPVQRGAPSRIAGVLRTIDDPDEAAEELVDLAVDGGGRDNVTVVVVDVVEDGGVAERLAALAGARRRRRPHRARAQPAVTDRRPTWRALPASRPTGRDRPGGLATTTAVGRRRRAATRAAAPDARGSRGGCCCSSCCSGGAGRRRDRHHPVVRHITYFVGFDGDEVAIYKGRPGGVLWIDPELVEPHRHRRDEVPEPAADIEAGRSSGSLADARRYVANVTEQADGGHRPGPRRRRRRRPPPHPRPTTTTAPADDHGGPPQRPSWASSSWARCSSSAPTCWPACPRTATSRRRRAVPRRDPRPAARRPLRRPAARPARRRHAAAAGVAAQRPRLRVHRAPRRGKADPDGLAGLQSVWMALGVAALHRHAGRGARRPKLERYRYTAGFVGLGLLLLPLVPDRRAEINGSRIWVSLGPVNFQPASSPRSAWPCSSPATWSRSASCWPSTAVRADRPARPQAPRAGAHRLGRGPRGDDHREGPRHVAAVLHPVPWC